MGRTWASHPWAPSSISPVNNIDLAYCLRAANQHEPQDESRCPGFMADAAIQDAINQCREVGGTLRPNGRATVFALDVNQDQRWEYLYEFNANFACDGAAAYFSCGTSNCPWTLYQHNAGEWQVIGQFSEGNNIRLMPRAGKQHFHDLLVRCDGSTCDSARYQWDGLRYIEIVRTLRGYAIELPLQGRLWSPHRLIRVLAQPRANSRVIGEYDQQAVFVIMGAALGTDYVSVSPCNACAAGFIHQRELQDATLH